MRRVLNINQLVCIYGAYAPYVLVSIGVCHELERGPRKWRRFSLTSDSKWPDIDYFVQIRSSFFTTSIGDLIDDAVLNLRFLADEMSTWLEKIPETLRRGPSYRRAEEVHSKLTMSLSYRFDDIPRDILDKKLVYLPTVPSLSNLPVSRDIRHLEALSKLRAVQKEGLINIQPMIAHIFKVRYPRMYTSYDD